MIDPVPTPGLELFKNIDVGEVVDNLFQEVFVMCFVVRVVRDLREGLAGGFEVLGITMEGEERRDFGSHGSFFLAIVTIPASMVSMRLKAAMYSAVRQRMSIARMFPRV